MHVFFFQVLAILAQSEKHSDSSLNSSSTLSQPIESKKPVHSGLNGEY